MLGDKEIVYNEELGAYDPCGECMEIIMETAYSGDFVHDDTEHIHGVEVLDEDYDALDDPENLTGFASFNDTIGEE